VNTKNIPDMFYHPLNKCFKVLVAISQKVLLQKRSMAYAKVIHKKKLKKLTSVQDVKNNAYLDACLKKRDE
jgi:hypothetical protein